MNIYVRKCPLKKNREKKMDILLNPVKNVICVREKRVFSEIDI